MKTLATTAVVMLFASVRAADASPFVHNHLEEHAVAGVHQAREIRSVIVTRFRVSRDYRDLVREADELLASMDSIHDAVHSRRSRSTMRSLVNQAQRQLRDLDRKVGRSDYTFSHPGYRQTTSTGYISFPPTHHPGVIHVDSVQTLLSRLDTNLDQLESDLEPTFHVAPQPYPYPYPYPYASPYGKPYFKGKGW